MEWFFSYIMKRTIYIQCDNDDDDVPFVVDQHAELDVSASSLKQNSSQVETSFHLYTLSCFWSNQSFLNVAHLAVYSLWFYPTWAPTLRLYLKFTLYSIPFGFDRFHCTSIKIFTIIVVILMFKDLFNLNQLRFNGL